jgi:hypothetical protein
VRAPRKRLRLDVSCAPHALEGALEDQPVQHKLIVLFLGLFASAGCRTSAPRAHSVESVASEHNRVEVYFGLFSPDGDGVSEQEWSRFASEVLVPRLHSLTVTETVGYWQDPDTRRVDEEPSRVVTHFFEPADAARMRATIDEIATDYKRRFRQQAVLVCWSNVRTDLVEDAPR